MTTPMFSGAGKIYDKCRRVKPMNKEERKKVYASCEINLSTKKSQGIKRFSPFSTVNRTTRNSYLLKVTKQTNTQTNYYLNFNQVLHRDRRSTMDKASFERIIGPVNKNDFSQKLDESSRSKCLKSFSSFRKERPLTVRQTHKWRKNFENLDFQKQLDPGRNNPREYLKTMKSTQDSFELQSLRETTQSNFNNFKRFSFQSHPQKSHDFKSDTGHQYLKKVYEREIEPEYDVTTNKEEFFRKSMKPPQGQMRIDLNRDKIVTRVDRADPNWLLTLQYTPDMFQEVLPQDIKTIDFTLTTNRQMNQVHSKYPIRQSLKPYIPLNKAS